MKRILGAAALAVIASTSVQAQDVNPWQDCGIGAMIFPENGGAAAISNIIWDLGTTAVSSASSSAESCEGERVKTAQFINETYNLLEDEIVEGNGDHFTAMLEMMQCDASAAQAIRTEVADKVLTSEQDKAEKLFYIAEEVCSAS